jgi:amino acid transporter
MSNTRLREERISKKVALAVFSSDALSSTAYATQEILLVLVIAGTGVLAWSLPIAIAIGLLLAVVVVSYRQLVRAYPGGGGSYTVAFENLGPLPGLTAAAALLIDYTLTVAVSIAASVEAIVSAFPDVHPYAVPLAIALVLLIAMGNLRGVRESGTAFAIPTYGFVFLLGGTILVGLAQVFLSDDPNIFRVGVPDKQPTHQEAVAGIAFAWLVLRAFSAGSAALTGVEAISNGVDAFKPPEWKNAITTMTAMGLLLGFLFIGTTLLARHFGIVYEEGDRETVMSQVGEEVYGGRNILYYLLQFLTAGILFLAANTAFSGYPMLGSILARDGFLPRMFHQRGNRLVFSYGILALTGGAILLLVGFNATTTRLIPLYALGVFLCFTLAQAGMVKRWLKVKDEDPTWKRSLVINAVGGGITGAVFVIILATKFTGGGWMVVVAVPIATYLLFRIGGFYKRLKRELHVPDIQEMNIRPHGPSRVPALVPVEEINLPTVIALNAACERSSDVTAIHVDYDVEDGDTLARRWSAQFPHIPLVVIESPYRTVAEPLSWYVADRVRQFPNEAMIIVPAIKVRHWYQRPLVNQSLRRLKTLLKKRKTVELIEQPFAIR